MAKICQQCGLKHGNNATKCIACGTEFPLSQSSSKNKKYLIFAILGVLLAVGAIVCILLFTGPKATVRRIMESYKRNDAEAIIATFPDFFKDSEKINSQTLQTQIEIETKSLSDYIFSYNIEEAKTPTAQERQQMMEDFRYFAGEDFNENDIQDIKIIWVNYKGNVTGIWPIHATRFIMIKYNGRWCCWPNNVNREGYTVEVESNCTAI